MQLTSDYNADDADPCQPGQTPERAYAREDKHQNERNGDEGGGTCGMLGKSIEDDGQTQHS